MDERIGLKEKNVVDYILSHSQDIIKTGISDKEYIINKEDYTIFLDNISDVLHFSIYKNSWVFMYSFIIWDTDYKHSDIISLLSPIRSTGEVKLEKKIDVFLQTLKK